MNNLSKYLLTALLALFALSGCGGSTVTGEWSCPVDQPDGCFTVESGDRIALRAIKNRNLPPFRGSIIDTEITLDEETTKPNAPATLEDGPIDIPLPRTSSLDNKALHSQRLPEELAEITIGSFVDAAGNFHPAGTIYIVVRPAEWRGAQ